MLSYGLVGYTVIDVSARVKSLYFAAGSTESIAVLFIPVFSPFVILIIGWSSAGIAYVLKRRRES